MKRSSEVRNFEVINGLQHVFEKWVERCKKCIVAKGGTSEKRDRHRTSTKFRLGVIRWFHELFKQPSYLKYVRNWLWLIWLRIGTTGGILRTLWWNFVFYKRQRISWLTDRFSRKTLQDEVRIQRGPHNAFTVQIYELWVVWNTLCVSL
jgi:hypothetical protein